MVCHGKNSVNNAKNKEGLIGEKNKNEYFKNIKDDILMNKFFMRANSFSYKKYRKSINNENRNSLYSTLTKY